MMKIIKNLYFVIFMVLLIFTGVILRISGGNYYSVSADEAHRLSMDTTYYVTLEKLKDLTPDYTLVDISPAEEYHKNKLPGAINIGFENLLKKENTRTYSKHDIIAIYSSELSKSVKAKFMLNQLGFKHVYILE